MNSGRARDQREGRAVAGLPLEHRGGLLHRLVAEARLVEQVGEVQAELDVVGRGDDGGPQARQQSIGGHGPDIGQGRSELERDGRRTSRSGDISVREGDRVTTSQEIAHVDMEHRSPHAVDGSGTSSAAATVGGRDQQP